MDHGKKNPKIISDNELINEERMIVNTNINVNTYSKSKNDLDHINKILTGNNNNNNNTYTEVSDSHVDTHSIIIRCKEMRDAYHVDIGHRLILYIYYYYYYHYYYYLKNNN